jgi:hypothetical protein
MIVGAGSKPAPTQASTASRPYKSNVTEKAPMALSHQGPDLRRGGVSPPSQTRCSSGGEATSPLQTCLHRPPHVHYFPPHAVCLAPVVLALRPSYPEHAATPHHLPEFPPRSVSIRFNPPLSACTERGRLAESNVWRSWSLNTQTAGSHSPVPQIRSPGRLMA